MPRSTGSGSNINILTRTSRRGGNAPSPSGFCEMEYELSKDGDLVPVSSGLDTAAGQDEDIDSHDGCVTNVGCEESNDPGLSHISNTSQSRSKRKQTFERRNIKRVREENALSEETQSAQRAEMERLLRLQMEQETQLPQACAADCWTLASNSDTNQTNSTLSADATQIDLKKCEEEKKSDVAFASSSPFPKVAPSQPLSTASEKLFKQKQHTELQSGDSEETAIVLLGDSDDDIELPIDDAAIEIMNNPVIELSDDENEEEAENGNKLGDEVQAEFCELRDADNLPDSEGRICIRRGATDAESFYLAPHIARVIKPHQVSGVRFLFDNLVESRTQFQRSSGFGCILAHSMGLGKSIQVIAFLDLIFRCCRPAARTVLLIVPINTLQNWQAEFQLWLPSVLHSSFLNDEEKPKVNGHQSAQQQPTPVVQSAPSLLSLISDSPPSHRPQSNSTEVATVDRKENAGEPQFPPPPPSPQGNQQKAQETPHEAPPFRLHVIKDTTKSLDARYQVVTEWARTGGVLLMGYEMFRLLTNPRKQTRANVSGGASFGYGGVGGGLSTSASTSSLFTLASSPFSADCERPRNRKKKRVITIDIEREEKEEHMLVDMRIALTDPGPQIVICDEGHRIKNSEASISRALKALRTRRRVVLTGYPLQNNLMEYWCMVDFVRPNYLGTKSEFTNMFQRPIENGQCVDSTEADRKLMQGRAHVLHELLSGFVQRRSHAVLKASLPPKQEVVLMVRMSPLQRRLYTALMNYIAVSSNMYGSGLPTANTLQTYALCCKIWNHPDILWRVVKENVDDMMDFELDDASNAASGTSSQRARRKPNGNTTNPPPPGANPAQSTGEDKYNWVTSDLWGAEFRAGDIQNSGKLVLFLSLLQESVRLGDKMLLFSQSLLTLDHLERILGQLPFDYATPSLAAKCVTPLAHQGEAEASQILHCQSDLKPESESAKQPQVWVRNVHYFRLDGSTSATDRDRLIRRFNDPENPVKLFLVSTRAGSLGVNLVGANRVVVFDASWNPCHDCQAVCRVYRYGQQKPCYIYRLVSDNTMERKIYDRQVNKQGVSDRVVDEMNPGQQFTRAQVGVLVAYEDKDMPTLTDEDLQSISDLTDSDPVLKAALETNKEWITAKPFTHESLLIDRKDYRLTRVEKRIARQRYEQERLISSSAMYRNSAAAATALQYHQYMMMVAASGSGGASFGNMSMGAPSSHRGTPNILSKSASGFHHQNLPVFPSAPHPFIPPSSTIDDSVLRRYEGIQRNRMLQKDLDEARIRAVSREIGIALPNGPLGSDYKITRVAATTDLVFPRSTHPPAPERSISKGEVVEIIQAGNNGKYLRLPRTGDIYVVKPGSKGPEPEDPQSHPVQKQSHNPPSASIPNPSSTLCPHCRQPSSSNCLCSNNLYPHSASTASSISNPSASAYHPPTYTNQYAPTGSYGPTAPHGYPNY
uniref:DUF953 domain-containing protein n=3 Tax=Mesocestoides corti TaxID=53468 RepID=A0A5K3ETY3_MESCO